MELTQEEKNFIAQVIAQLTISPAQENAGAILVVSQSILNKLKETSGKQNTND